MKVFLCARPSALAPACAPAVAAWAHADIVGQPAVQILMRHPVPPCQGISGSVSGFGFPAATSGKVKINYSNYSNYSNYINGITSVAGVGVATALRDPKVQGAEARGIPPRGRPV